MKGGLTTMKGRWILIGLVLGLAVALTLGFAFVGPGAGEAPVGGFGGMSVSDMDRMHEQMRAKMAEHMTDEQIAQCEAMHAQMQEQMGSGMMGPGSGMGSGMMGPGSGMGSGMMGPGSGMGSGMMGWSG